MKLSKFLRPLLAVAALGIGIVFSAPVHAQQQMQQFGTSRKIVFLLVQSSDHISPLTGASPTVTLSKNGAAFASPVGSVAEIGSGLYSLSPGAADTGTLGPLFIHVTAANADPVDKEYNIVAYNPDDAAGLGLARLDTAVGSRQASGSPVVLPTLPNVTVGGFANGVTTPDSAGVGTLLTRVSQTLLFSSGGFVKAFSILDLSQPLDETLVGATTGGAMNGARSAIGKVTITGTPGQSGSVMTFYKADGVTVLKTLSLSISGSRQ